VSQGVELQDTRPIVLPAPCGPAWRSRTCGTPDEVRPGVAAGVAPPRTPHPPHVLLCWLALLLTRVAERRTGLTWHLASPPSSTGCNAVTLTGTAGSVVHTTPLTTTQAGIAAACQVPALAVVTAPDPV
jgi:hypothetical protein